MICWPQRQQRVVYLVRSRVSGYVEDSRDIDVEDYLAANEKSDLALATLYKQIERATNIIMILSV
jgi:hypothetical protein